MAAGQALDLPGMMLHRGELTPRAVPLATFLVKRMEQRLRELAGFPYAITAEPTRYGCTEELAQVVDQAVEKSGIRVPVTIQRPEAKTKITEDALPPPTPPPPVTVDFTQLEHIRTQANELTELLIVEEEPLRLAPEAAINLSGLTLREALSQEQISLIDNLIAGGGTADELATEAINELALDIIGDNLIESGKVVEEYIAAWKDGSL